MTLFTMLQEQVSFTGPKQVETSLSGLTLLDSTTRQISGSGAAKETTFPLATSAS